MTRAVNGGVFLDARLAMQADCYPFDRAGAALIAPGFSP